MYEPIWIVSVKALVEQNDKLLLLERHSYDGGLFWDLPGGCLDGPSESYEQAFSRELAEEIGYHGSLVVGDVIATQRWHVEGSGYPPKLILFFAVSAKIDAITLSDEHAGYRWIEPSLVSELAGATRLEPELAEAVAAFARRRPGR